MAGVPAGLPAGVRVSDHISLGVIAKTFPPDRVQQVLAETGKASERERDLPAQVMVYYAIAMALYMGSSTREVLRCLLEGLRWLWGADAVKVAGKSGISQARSRLGEMPLRRLYEQVVQPVATRATKGAWYRTWRLVSLDGSSLDVADTDENGASFGYPGASRGESAFPQLRFVALVENGTHVLFGTRLGGTADGETTLAHDVVPALRPGMLCLADRQFFGHTLWQAGAATDADLLWRVKSNLRLPRATVLADGSSGHSQGVTGDYATPPCHGSALDCGGLPLSRRLALHRSIIGRRLCRARSCLNHDPAQIAKQRVPLERPLHEYAAAVHGVHRALGQIKLAKPIERTGDRRLGHIQAGGQATHGVLPIL